MTNGATNLSLPLRLPTRGTDRRRSRAVAALAVVAALTLAGCAGTDEPGAEPTTQTASAMTPAPTTPAPAATTPAPEPAGANVIATPADGSTVAGPQVEVTGEGTAFEGTLSWRVLTAGTAEIVTENFTTAGANGEVGPFMFTVELTPGTFTLEVWEPDMSDGAGDGATDGRRGLATSTFTVS